MKFNLIFEVRPKIDEKWIWNYYATNKNELHQKLNIYSFHT